MDRRRNWPIIVLVALVVFLVACVLFLLLRTGTGARVVRGVSEMPGVRMLLGELDLSWAGVDAKARQLLERGAELEAEERYREAEQVYKEAQTLMPNQVDAYLALASVYEALGDGAASMEQLEKAVEVDPEDAAALRRLGRVQCISGDHETCIETLTQAVELAPDDPLGRYWLGLAYQRDAQDGQERAEELLVEALRIEPDLGRAHLSLGSLYRDQPGREAEAFEELQRALDVALRSGDTDLEIKARTELAAYYRGQDNLDQCVEELLRVLEEYPEDPDTRRRLGICYVMGDDEEDLARGLAELELALKLDFEQMDAYYFYLGRYYALQQDFPRAFLAWDQLLRFSDNEELKEDVRALIDRYDEAMQMERDQ